MLEKNLERKIKEYAENKEYVTYKFSSPANIGIPDRIFINKWGYIFFIEFKSATGKLSEMQKYTMQKLENRNVNIFVVDNYERGKNIIDKCSDFIVDVINS